MFARLWPKIISRPPRRELNSYRAKNGVTAEYVEAYSWMARTALGDARLRSGCGVCEANQGPCPEHSSSVRSMRSRICRLRWARPSKWRRRCWQRAASARRRLPFCRARCETYGNTSIRARLQKNLNLLSFEGKPAPALRAEQFLGSKPPTLAQLKGSPVLLFFWAHWCGDCKAEAPIITQLRTEFASQGLTVVGPTRLYGYTAQVENASPSDELAYIDAVRHRFYGGLLDMPVPISKYNFDVYGASTTPTLVLLDRSRQSCDVSSRGDAV